MRKSLRVTVASAYLLSVLIGSAPMGIAQENNEPESAVVEGNSDSGDSGSVESKPASVGELLRNYKDLNLKKSQFKNFNDNEIKDLAKKHGISLDGYLEKDGEVYLNVSGVSGGNGLKGLSYDEMTSLIGQLSGDTWSSEVTEAYNNLERNYDEFRDLVNTFIRNSDSAVKERFLPAVSLYVQLKQKGIDPFEVVPDVSSGSAWSELYRYLTEGKPPVEATLGGVDFANIDNVRLKYQYHLENGSEVSDKVEIQQEDGIFKIKPKVEDGSTLKLVFHKYDKGSVKDGDKMEYGVAEGQPLHAKFSHPLESEYFEMTVVLPSPAGSESESVVESGTESSAESESESVVESGTESEMGVSPESEVNSESSSEPVIESTSEESSAVESSESVVAPESSSETQSEPETSAQPEEPKTPERPVEPTIKLPVLESFYNSKNPSTSLQMLPVGNEYFGKFVTEAGKEILIPKAYRTLDSESGYLVNLIHGNAGESNNNHWAEVTLDDFFGALHQETPSFYNNAIDRYMQYQGVINDLWMIFVMNKDLTDPHERDLWASVVYAYYYTLLGDYGIKFEELVDQYYNENFVAMRDAILGYLSTRDKIVGDVYHDYDGSIPYTEYSGELNGRVDDEVQGATGRSVLLAKSNLFYWYKAEVSDPSKLRVDYHEDGSIEIVPLVLDGSEQTVTFKKYNVARLKEPMMYFNYGSDAPLLVNFNNAGLTDSGDTEYKMTLTLSEFVESDGNDGEIETSSESTESSSESQSESESKPEQPKNNGYSGSSNGVSSVTKTDDIRSTYETVEEDIPYETEYVINPKMKPEEKKIIQEGVAGRKILLYEVILTNGKETSRLLQSEEVKVEPVKQIIEVRAKEGTFDEMLEEPIPFETIERQNNELGKGKEQVAQEGVDGKLIATYTVTYVNGEVTNKVLKGEPKRIEPLPKIVEKGNADIEVVEEVRKVDVPISDDIEYSIDLPVGQESVVAEGENGLMEVTYDVTYRNGTEISRTVKTQKLLKEAKPRKVKKGIKKEYQQQKASAEVKAKPSGAGLYAVLGLVFILGIFGLVKVLFKR